MRKKGAEFLQSQAFGSLEQSRVMRLVLTVFPPKDGKSTLLANVLSGWDTGDCARPVGCGIRQGRSCCPHTELLPWKSHCLQGCLPACSPPPPRAATLRQEGQAPQTQAAVQGQQGGGRGRLPGIWAEGLEPIRGFCHWTVKALKRSIRLAGSPVPSQRGPELQSRPRRCQVTA